MSPGGEGGGGLIMGLICADDLYACQNGGCLTSSWQSCGGAPSPAVFGLPVPFAGLLPALFGHMLQVSQVT